MEKCQEFIKSVLARRIARVTSWIEINFPVRERLSHQLLLMLDGLIQKYETQYFSVIMKEWTLCRNFCQQKTGKSEQCQRECLLLKCICCNEQSEGCQKCNCLEKDYSCTEKCESCVTTSAGMSNSKLCHLGAEQDIGIPHRCDQLSHECKEKCSKLQARNWIKKCKISYETKHDRHLCGAGSNHKCTNACSVCKSICDLEFEHDVTLSHRCAELQCIRLCQVQGCNRQCSDDHLHSVKLPLSSHFCRNNHICVHVCSVNEERCLKTNTVKAPCTVRIPSKQLLHNEPHYCRKVHYCNQNCPCGCNELCTKKWTFKKPLLLKWVLRKR